MNRLRGAYHVAQSSLMQICLEAGEILQSAANQGQGSMDRAQGSQAGKDAVFGGRIWLLPRWYIYAVKNQRALTLAYAELLIGLFNRPRMICAGKVYGPVQTGSGIAWAVRKGLPGRLTFQDGRYDVLQHETWWPDNIDTMSSEEWEQVDEERRESRSLEEARELKRLYGTAIGVPLRHPDSLARLGCLTIHTKRGHSLADEEVDLVVELLVTRTSELCRQIVRAADLRL